MDGSAGDGRSDSPAPSGRCVLVLVGASALLWVAIWFDATPYLRGPAPFPPEWQWPYLEDKPAFLSPWVLFAGFGLVGLLGLSGSRRARNNPRSAAIAMLLAASLLGPALQLALLEKSRPMPVVVTLARLTELPGFTGHYTAGVSPMARDPLDFVRSYPEHVQDLRRRWPHVATHPPGSSLFYRAVLGVCESSPRLSRAALQLIEAPDATAARSPTLSAKKATAVVAPLLLMLLAASACWPIAMSCRAFGATHLAAARVGVLWALLPGPTLMIPEIDQLVAALIAWTAGLLATALAGAPAWPLRALAAGVGAFLAVFVSYGAAAFVLITAGLCVGLCSGDWNRFRHALKVVLLAALAGLAMLGLSVAIGYRPIDAFFASIGFLASSYSRTRSYTTWIFFGPWDLVVFLGLPIAILFAARLGCACAAIARDGVRRMRDPILLGQLGLAVALAALFLSGTLRGEVGRIGVPIMSLCLVAALLPAGATASNGVRSETGDPTARFSVLIAALLLVSCWVLRMSWAVP